MISTMLMQKRDSTIKATNIRIHEDTKKEFDACGTYEDTADTILKRLINFYNKYKDMVKNGRAGKDK